MRNIESLGPMEDVSTLESVIMYKDDIADRLLLVRRQRKGASQRVTEQLLKDSSRWVRRSPER